ncbi:MAG: zinc metallopeptidase [Alphaproteobacteria bacterium]|nr:zinc metallopeptidase [Alphaproteobacteria bacterium]
MIWIVPFLLLLALVYAPNLWVKRVMRRHAADRPDLPGTGGELARHLLDEAGLQTVGVEQCEEGGDHYSPLERVVRLSPSNHDGRSITAVAVAAHEVAHAIQHRDGDPKLAWRTQLAGAAGQIERLGSVVLLATPLVGIVLRSPLLLALEIGIGLLMMSSRIVVHALTLPMELDASFRRALPALDAGGYLAQRDMPAARQVLRAAALTYVAAGLASLLDVLRWVRILR